MGNFFEKSSSHSEDVNFKITAPVIKPLNKFPNVTREHFNKDNVSDSVERSQSSFSSFCTQKSNPSFSSFTRPWSRISRKKWSEKTLSDPLSCSKTAWPVPNFESLFLPEFKIKDKITENSFHIIGTLSSGAFGKVFKAIKHGSNDVYAMKILSKAQLVANNSINQVKEEVKIQQLVGHHPFIVNCPFYWQSRKQLYIVSEYISGGELLKLLLEKGSLPIEIVRLYTAELAITLDFLHNAGIIYRDLKLENILLNSKGHIQLIDFGLSKWLKFGMRTNTVCGTLQYIAPEILQQKPYTHAVDWWSLGIVFVCMINGQCPYECCLDENGEVQPKPELNGEKEVKDLVDRLLVADPVKRLRSLAAIKRTAFFFNFDFDQVLNFSVDLSKLKSARRKKINLFHLPEPKHKPIKMEEAEREFGQQNDNLMKIKKSRYRRRPFYLEDKRKEGRSSASTCNMLEDRYCRICFDEKKKEMPITACRCKGTIGLVHMSCLEKWLSLSNTHSCELCGYNFKTLRTPKYRVLYSIYYWVFLDRNPQYHRGLKSDFIVFIVLTPIAFIGVYSCIIAADFYSKEPNKYSPASRWTTISLLIMVVLLTFAYYLWVAVTIRFHMRIWYVWWQANNIVKVMSRDSTNSFEGIPLSVRSSASRPSSRRIMNVNEASSSITESVTNEIQPNN